ncbi:MAG: DUF3524 domain-containing protein, partial [Fidelibacterota bacterium]
MKKKILLIDPYFGGSHSQWANGLKRYSQFDISIMSLPARHWKWRMHGGAISLSQKFNRLKSLPHLIFTTDMMDVTTFRAMTFKRSAKIPIAVYFHENQFGYPISEHDSDIILKRDDHYGFINYSTALACDHIAFNSHFHCTSFLSAVRNWLKKLPDHNLQNTTDIIEKKSSVLFPGIENSTPMACSSNHNLKPPLIIWNHRWEYDKNPIDFFESLIHIKQKGIQFKLAILGSHHEKYPPIFDKAKKEFRNELVAFGYVENKQKYIETLNSGSVLPVTSKQDFFGISIMEAISCGCRPLLPDRLSYPELIPKEYHDEVLYSGIEEFESKLESILTRPQKLSRSQIKEI